MNKRVDPDALPPKPKAHHWDFYDDSRAPVRTGVQFRKTPVTPAENKARTKWLKDHTERLHYAERVTHEAPQDDMPIDGYGDDENPDF